MGNILGRPSNDGPPARKKKKSAGRRKKKDDFLDSNKKRADLDEDEEEGPQMALQEMYKLLAQRRIATRKTLSVARWRPDRGLAEAMVMKGNMWQNMGIVRSGRNYCQVEEALYMVERGSLLLLLGSEPASVQQVHSLLLHQGRSLQAYHAYCNLRKLGYVIQRYDTPWVHPVSQNRRKLEADKKGAEGIEGNAGGREDDDVESGEVVSGVNGDDAEEKVKGATVKGDKFKGAKVKGAKDKGEKVAEERVKDGKATVAEAKEDGVEQGNDKKGNGKKEKVKKEKGGKGKNGNREGSAEDKASTSSASVEGRSGFEGEGNQRAVGPPMRAVIDGSGLAAASDPTDEVREGVDTEVSTSKGGKPGTSAPGDESQSQGGSNSLHESDHRTDGSDGAAGKTGEIVGGIEVPSGIIVNETEKGSTPDAADFAAGPGLTEESVANAATEDFRKGPVSGAPAGRKRQSPGPLDLNEACTFVNLNVKNYHPLAAYLFVGQPKKQGRPMANGHDGRSDVSANEVVASQRVVPMIDGASQVLGNGQNGPSAADHVSTSRPDDVTIDIVEPGTASPAAPNRPTSSDATSAALPAESVVVDLGALHSLLDLSRCTMPPPIPKPSTWQKLTWHLRRILRWRLWPWRWGRGRQRQELGTGRNMRPLMRTVDKRPQGSSRSTRGKLFPDNGRSSSVDAEESQTKPDSETSFLRGASEETRERGGQLLSGLWGGNQEERLEAIQERRAAVYDVWQPNSRFRKTDPGRPYFRLIIAGAQPPTRREIHLYRDIYGGDGIPLKYCFVEMTGASTFFSYDPVALPSVL